MPDLGSRAILKMQRAGAAADCIKRPNLEPRLTVRMKGRQRMNRVRC